MVEVRKVCTLHIILTPKVGRHVHHCYTKGSYLALHQMVEGREDSCGTCTLMQFFHIRRLCLLCVYVLVLLCSCCREALLEDLHVVVVVGEVPSVALLVLVAGAPNFDVDLVMVVVDGIIAVVVIAVEVRLATAPF